MYDNTTLKVLEQIYIHPSIHKRAISRNLKITMPSIGNSIKKIADVVKAKKSGNQINYSLNYSKEGLIPLLCSVENLRFNRLPPKVKIAIRELLSELKEKPTITAIFGSYARGDYSDDSDLDLLLIFQKKPDSEEIENTSRKISLNTSAKLSPVYMDYNSFKESFHNATKDFFKNLKKDKIIITGAEWWIGLENEEA